MIPELSCPCCSNLLYSDCCQPYHQHKLHPPTPLALMRSRYCAYAKGLCNYIIETTHPQNPAYMMNRQGWIKTLEKFSQSTEFQRLEIIEFLDGSDKAFVSFNAYLKQQSKDVSFMERSCFIKTDGRWLYLGGVVKSISP